MQPKLQQNPIILQPTPRAKVHELDNLKERPHKELIRAKIQNKPGEFQQAELVSE